MTLDILPSAMEEKQRELERTRLVNLKIAQENKILAEKKAQIADVEVEEALEQVVSVLQRQGLLSDRTGLARARWEEQQELADSTTAVVLADRVALLDPQLLLLMV